MSHPSHWAVDSIFYHIYPLGFCGAPPHNDFSSQPVNRLDKLREWLPHIRRLGCNALYLGPVFESTAHGYDTANYSMLDRRLGDIHTLSQLSTDLHRAGLRLVLDGVFNHVGRDFWAFKDVQQYGASSAYRDWFYGLRFDARSPFGDPFTYQSWANHYDLVKLNLRHPDVRSHLFEAVAMWIQEFNLDGLRLDAADCLDLDFMQALRAFCRQLRPDFWLMGEVVHGDYRRWANPTTLDSVTNYECYKSLYSSLVDKNFFEIAYALNRQFGTCGIYQDLPLYNFADNHDVDRVAASLGNPAHLYPLYLLLFSMPGVPSIYYGSEWGLSARRAPHSDAELRPSLDLDEMQRAAPQRNLPGDISRLAAIRRSLPALRRGGYHPLHVGHEQMAFARFTGQESVVVVLNAADKPVALDIQLPRASRSAVDVLNQNERFAIQEASLRLERVEPHWGRILKLEESGGF